MFEQLKNGWKAENTRHFLWVPVCFAGGIALYYSLRFEPSGWLFPVFALAAFVATLLLRRIALPIMVAVLLMTLGASWAGYRVNAHTPIMLREALTPRTVLGEVRDIERTQAGVRLLLGKVTIDGLASELTPKQVRLSVKFKKGATFELPRVGDGISIRAGLMPPMGPALPSGFDFARYFYVRDIGAVGYGFPPWQIIAPDRITAFKDRFWSWRAELTDEIVRALGPERGGIASGLITGDGRAISDDDFDALRASNLYHIIAISGEHMVIISGVIFIGLRLLLLLLPRQLGLRPVAKSLVAVATLALVTVYLFITGLPTSAVRAYVMIVLVLLAILMRRYVDPMRSLAVAALLMLVYDPATLLDPGFQLSFAATLAIIALVEARVMALPPTIERGRVRRLLHHALTLVLVSVVAEAATAPFAIAMFNNASLYGVMANSMATPLVSLFLMPVVALFFILLPLGLEHWALQLLDVGIHALLSLARWVSSLPHAQFFVPSPPSWGLMCFALGLLWLCLWQTNIRRYGLVFVALGLVSFVGIKTPDMLVGSGLKQIAFRSDDGYVLARGREGSMIADLWANGLGYKTLPKAETQQWRCDRLGCIAKVNGKKIAFTQNSAAMLDDCRNADAVLAVFTPVRCETAARTMDAKALLGGGVQALWVMDNGTIKIEHSADWQGDRPWNVRVEEVDDE